MPRLFLGCPLPKETATQLRRWAEENVEGKLVSEENLHVTLRFFGGVSQANVSELMQETAKLIWSPILVRTGKLDRFGRTALAVRLHSVNSARGVTWSLPGWPVFGEGNERVLESGLHVTVARLRGKTKKELPQPPEISFALDRVVLYESLLNSAGAVYRELATSMLAKG